MAGADDIYIGPTFRAGLRLAWALFVLGGMLAISVGLALIVSEERKQTRELQRMRHLLVEDGVKNANQDRADGHEGR